MFSRDSEFNKDSTGENYIIGMKQKHSTEIDRLSLNTQFAHWQNTYLQTKDIFGLEPSEPARKTAILLKREGKTKILELGGGQGRDTLFFALGGFQVCTLGLDLPP